MTPFIDVILVLLIIFMVAAPLATVDIGVNLPASTAPEQPRPDKPVFVTVKPDGTLAIGESLLRAMRLRRARPRPTTQGRNDFRPRRQDAQLWRTDGGDEHPARCRLSQARAGRAGSPPAKP